MIGQETREVERKVIAILKVLSDYQQPLGGRVIARRLSGLGKMTSVSEVAREDNGKMLASFCEIPAIARSNAEAVIKDLEVADIKSLVMLGRRGEPVYQIPVAANRVGMVLADGLNPVAAAVEAGTEVINRPMSGGIDFGKLEHFKDCQSLRR